MTRPAAADLILPLLAAAATFALAPRTLAAESGGVEVPMYGHQRRSPAEEAEDLKLLERIDSLGVSRAEAAAHACQRGWDAMRRGDLAEAMRQFNQGWLLNPQDGQVQWGFARVLEQRGGDRPGAERLYGRALALLRDDARLLVDYGRFLAAGDLHARAVTLFERGLALDPKVAGAHPALALSRLALGDKDAACRHLEQAAGQGERFAKGAPVAALGSACGKPTPATE